MLPLVLAGLTLTVIFITKPDSSKEVSYYIELTGFKDNRYPNGTVFSPQDLLNPQVITRLLEKFSLDDSRVLRDSVTVEFGTPASPLILKEYRSALSSGSKANPEDISRVNQRFQIRLKDAQRRGLRISVAYGALGLEKTQGKELARALPDIWNNVFSQQFRIFANPEIPGIATVAQRVNLSTVDGALEAELQLAAMRSGVAELKSDARFRGLTVEGISPADLEGMIDNFQRIYFDAIFSNSFMAGGDLTSIYRRDLEFTLAEHHSTLADLNDRITVITDLQQETLRADSGLGEKEGYLDQVQLEGDALSQLVSLSRTASLADYLQQSFNQRIALVKDIASIDSGLAKMDADSDSALPDGFSESANNRYSELALTYTRLLKSADEAARTETPVLYAGVSDFSSEKLLERRDFLFIALALALGGMLSVIGALLAPNPSD